MKRLIAAIAALALAAPAVASAQSWNGGDGDHHDGGYGDQHWGGYNGGDRSGDGRHDGGARYNDGGRYNGGYSQQGWRGDRDWRGGRGYGDRSASWYSRGSYLPPYYRGYAVSDYGRYHLRQPPRGYYWYRTGNDFVLAALATGLIYDLATAGSYGNNGYRYDSPGRHGYGQYDSYRGYGH